MSKSPEQADPVAVVRNLSLEQIERRLVEIDGERASLSLLRRSIVARERAERRTRQRSITNAEGQR